MFVLSIMSHHKMFRDLLLVYPILDIAGMLVCSGYVLAGEQRRKAYDSTLLPSFQNLQDLVNFL